MKAVKLVSGLGLVAVLAFGASYAIDYLSPTPDKAYNSPVSGVRDVCPVCWKRSTKDKVGTLRFGEVELHGSKAYACKNGHEWLVWVLPDTEQASATTQENPWP